MPRNISLLHLPPYSPELNPIENLWHYLRSHYWSNRYYTDIKALEEEAQRSWEAVCLDSQKIQTVCAVHIRSSSSLPKDHSENQAFRSGWMFGGITGALTGTGGGGGVLR